MAKLIRELDRFRQIQMRDHPFWAVISAGLTFDTTTDGKYRGQDLPTAMTDGEYLVVNEEFWADKTTAYKQSVYMHELLHVTLGHHLRRGDRDPYLFNVACDHEINLSLKEMNLWIPKEEWYCDDQYKGWSAERIYNKLKQDDDNQEGEPDKPDNSDGGCGGEGDPGQTAEQEGDQQAQGDGEAEPGDKQEDKPMPVGEVWDPVGSGDDGKLTQEDIVKKTTELSENVRIGEVAQQKSCGSGVGPTVTRQFAKFMAPKTDWRKLMQQWVTRVGKPSGRTWSRLDRRALRRGLYQPDEIKEGLRWLVVFGDASDSVSEKEYAGFMSNLDEIRKVVKIDKITVVPFSTHIKEDCIEELRPGTPTPKTIPIGGGTSFAPCFEWLKEHTEEPDAVMVFTDLCCSDYGERPKCPVLWASTDEVYKDYDGWYSNHPPFGDVIQIEF